MGLGGDEGQCWVQRGEDQGASPGSALRWLRVGDGDEEGLGGAAGWRGDWKATGEGVSRGGLQARRGCGPEPERLEGWATERTAPGVGGGEASHPREDGR